MSRLKKVARPRPKHKEVWINMRLCFEVSEDNDDLAAEVCAKFKDWARDQFAQWDKSILEHFLYEYGLSQNSNDDKYMLDFYIDKIIKDETLTPTEQEEYMEEIRKQEEEQKKEEE